MCDIVPVSKWLTQYMRRHGKTESSENQSEYILQREFLHNPMVHLLDGFQNIINTTGQNFHKVVSKNVDPFLSSTPVTWCQIETVPAIQLLSGTLFTIAKI